MRQLISRLRFVFRPYRIHAVSVLALNACVILTHATAIVLVDDNYPTVRSLLTMYGNMLLLWVLWCVMRDQRRLSYFDRRSQAHSHAIDRLRLERMAAAQEGDEAKVNSATARLQSEMEAWKDHLDRWRRGN